MQWWHSISFYIFSGKNSPVAIDDNVLYPEEKFP
jgi:hypothetical protein